MPNRSAKSDPQPGDVLRFRDWTIEVLGRDDSTVHYRAKQADDKYWRKNTTQPLIEWQSWTGEAKVSRRGMAPGECCITDFVTARCQGCREWVHKAMHLSDKGMRCGKCCDAAKHGSKKGAA